MDKEFKEMEEMKRYADQVKWEPEQQKKNYMADRYKLLKDYDSPAGKIYKDTVKSAETWKKQFGLFDIKEVYIRTDWFQKIEEKTIEQKKF